MRQLRAPDATVLIHVRPPPHIFFFSPALPQGALGALRRRYGGAPGARGHLPAQLDGKAVLEDALGEVLEAAARDTNTKVVVRIIVRCLLQYGTL